MTSFETAPKELQELCLCGGGPMGKVLVCAKNAQAKQPVENVRNITNTPYTESKPDEHGQGSLF